MKEIYTKRKDGRCCSTSVFWNKKWKTWTCTFTEEEFKELLRTHGIRFRTKDFNKKKKNG